jgi:hypothetical protein
VSLARRLLPAAGGSGSFPRWWTTSGNLEGDAASTAIDTGTGYKAFPGLTVLADGSTLLLVYRHGTEHISSDGHIVKRTSTDGGLTWSAASTIYDPSDDARDPSLVTLADGTIALSCFRYDGSIGYQVEVLYSTDNGATWGTPVVVSSYYAGNGVTYSQIGVSAPVVELGDGTQLLPVYARNAGGTTRWNAFLARSTDSGATWGLWTVIGTGDVPGGGGIGSWTEPFVVQDTAGDLLCLTRIDDGNVTYHNRSTDDGATWSAASVTFGGASVKSRAAMLLTQHGAIALSIRDWSPQYQGLRSTSWDDGATWEALLDLPAESSAYMYGALAQLASGRIVLVWSDEVSTTDADLYCMALRDTG